MSDVTRVKAQVQEWEAALQAFYGRMRPHFARPESWALGGRYLFALLLPVERCNTWQLAEAVGDATPHAFQQFLKAAVWDADGLRDETARYIYEHFGEPGGVLVLDESGIPKRGRESAGVGRQYIGCTGQVENAQVAVFAAYVSQNGAALVDRALYLPEDWIADPARCLKAHVPAGTGFATKPELARRQVERAHDAGAPFDWVSGDEVYGRDPALRAFLESRGIAYVLGVASDFNVWRGDDKQRVSAVLPRVPDAAWQRLSAGEGTRGERLFDWAALRVQGEPREGWHRWVLFRRTVDGKRVDYYTVAAPAGTSIEAIVGAAGARWAIEVCFEQAKGEVGMMDYEVRSWHGWHRHVSLAMAALAFLTVMRHEAKTAEPPKKRGLEASQQPSTLTAFKHRRGLSG